MAEPNGEDLFKANCAACHTIKTDLIGPALAGMMDRVPSKEWVYSWIRNSQKMIADGDEYGLERFEKFNKLPMLSFPDMTDDEIDAVIAYVAAAEVVEEPIVTANTEVISEEVPIKEAEEYDLLFLFTIVTASVLLFIFCVRVITAILSLRSTSPPKKKHFIHTLQSNRVITIFVLALAICGGYYVVVSAMELGRSPGYQPKQPIFFSHKIHSGDNKIDCQYCHSTAERSRHASIPSVNVCMNCHRAIKTFSGENSVAITKEEGTKEIEKILTAFDNNEPLQWVKIHNLPDHVYFSHAQHVTVGEVKCEECHGLVEEMDEVLQFAPLSMGWCVNCHRDTEVTQFKDNDYYTIFEKLHEDLKEGRDPVITAEQIGAIDCQKCHY